MPPQPLHIQHLQPPTLHGLQRQAQMRQFAIRKHIAVDERTTTQRRGAHVRIGGGDAVVQRQAVIGLQLDDGMVYSCAYFENGDEDLATAQRKKLDHILTRPSMSIWPFT